MQLVTGINFTKTTDNSIHTFYTHSGNEEIRLGDNANEITNKLTESLQNNYQKQLLMLRNGSDYVFGSVDSLIIKFHKIDLKRGGSFIKSHKRISDKKATINPKNNDNECLKYAITAALQHHEISNNPDRISKL